MNSTHLLAQYSLAGQVYEVAEDGKSYGLFGANVYWVDSDIGVFTNEDGGFEINYDSTIHKNLIISYVGFKTDTLSITSNKFIKHQLIASNNLDEIEISVKEKASKQSYLTPTNTIFVSSDELLKAACCNLSESFETNPSIDVNFADAISGTKQIKMLGLTSPYILVSTENVPSVRGASQAYGMSFIPGTWIESIQVTKGTGSVVNGYESIAGQINAELQKPSKDYSFFLNAFASTAERFELNTHVNQKVSDKLDAGIYLHGNLLKTKHDINNDGFMDMPNYDQINLLNRWEYKDLENGIIGFLNFRLLNDNKLSGQMDFDSNNHKFSNLYWGSEINTKRYEIASKLGYVNPLLPYQSLGVQLSFSYHQQDSYFGLRSFDIVQNSLYANIIYNSIISDSRHKIKTGITFSSDSFNESVNNIVYDRDESAMGSFFEYNFDNLDNLNLTAGIRFDYHNLMGAFVTPRLHVRYTPWNKSSLKLAIGKGQRTANVFAENQKLFASNRSIEILNTNGKIYGLDHEVAWNYGVSFLQGFNLFNKKSDINIDYFITDFKNQVVVDYENPLSVRFYNLNGLSRANSFQFEFSQQTFKNFDLRLAYKYYEVTTEYIDGRKSMPLTPKHRFFANLGYELQSNSSDSEWKFDLTFNWNERQRLPDTSMSPEEFRQKEYAPSIGTMNFQVTKVFSKKFEIYFGGENITNVRQNNPIINAENPFDDYFDSTMIYGPIFGSMYYTGLRLKID
ncbi:MAG: TonB-dependent receptor [Flavobacteriaceae bacterium]